MPIVSLIARRGALDPSLAHALRDAWGGGDVLWLSPDEAAEFAVAQVPANRAEVQAEVARRGVDLNVLLDGERRRRLFLADMDSTIIAQECIDELADLAGVGPRVAAITARAMNGELDFEGALRERVGLLAGLDASVIARVWAERITFTPGAEVLLATLRRDGVRCVLVSGGFTAFTGRVAGALGFHAHRANVLGEADGRLTGTVADPILGRDAKVAALEEEAAALETGPEEAMAVGDGANDLGMLGRAGAGVALHAKPVVAAQAALRVDHGDLTALLYLQGYARAEFAVTGPST